MKQSTVKQLFEIPIHASTRQPSPGERDNVQTKYRSKSGLTGSRRYFQNTGISFEPEEYDLLVANGQCEVEKESRGPLIDKTSRLIEGLSSRRFESEPQYDDLDEKLVSPRSFEGDEFDDVDRHVGSPIESCRALQTDLEFTETEVKGVIMDELVSRKKGRVRPGISAELYTGVTGSPNQLKMGRGRRRLLSCINGLRLNQEPGFIFQKPTLEMRERISQTQSGQKLRTYLRSQGIDPPEFLEKPPLRIGRRQRQRPPLRM